MAHTKNLAEVLRRKLADDPDLADAVENERFNASVGAAIFAARNEAGITQAKLAARIGTHQSVIARLESAEYDAHSFKMLKRIAEALGKRVEIYLVNESSKPSIESEPQRSKRR